MKNKGKGSKKVGRKERAEARRKSWETLTPEQKREVAERNKADYDSYKKLGV